MVVSRTRAVLLGLVCGIAVGATPRAEGGMITVYNSAASFGTATTGLTDVTFGGKAPAGGYVGYAIPSGYTDAASGTNFTFANAAGSNINITSATYYSSNFGTPVFPGDVIGSSSNVPTGASELITLPRSSTAVGLLFSGYDSSPITFRLSNGDTYVATANPAFGNFAFIGFTDTTAFTSLTITDPTYTGVLIADFRFGNATPAAAVPEPASLILLGAGLAGILGIGVRQARR